jgi:hypothetical protein
MGRRIARVLSLRVMTDNIDRTAHFGRAVPIYEVLTTMGKDGRGKSLFSSD